jgi:hypothetical protein
MRSSDNIAGLYFKFLKNDVHLRPCGRSGVEIPREIFPVFFSVPVETKMCSYRTSVLTISNLKTGIAYGTHGILNYKTKHLRSRSIQ